MITRTADPSTLAATLAAAKPDDTIQLRTGNYAGSFNLTTAGVTLEPAPGESPRFVGPLKPVAGTKPAWLYIRPTAKGATVRNLLFVREGEIAQAKLFMDDGIRTEADGVTVIGCRLMGMRIGIVVKGTSLRSTVTYNQVGPTYQSNMVVASSDEVIRALLVAWNVFEKSYIEDGIQFAPRLFGDTHSDEVKTDISNFGSIIYENEFRDIAENGLDMKACAWSIVHGNKFRRIAGSVDGPLNGWNHDSPACIMRGSNTTSRDVIIRNNDLEENSSGSRVYEGWHVYHNRAVDNNYSPVGTYDGFGISQIEKARSVIKNNLVSGNRNYNVQALTGAECNPATEGPGVALTATRGSGSGRILPLVDAGYFTDWYGRKDLPPDVLYLGHDRYEVQSVDYAANTVTLDRETAWFGSEPVYWRSPTPMVGVLDDAPVVVEPPPVEPAPDELVTLLLETSMSPADAAQLRALLAGRAVNVRLADASPRLVIESSGNLGFSRAPAAQLHVVSGDGGEE